ncbi:MAG TPA: hypothetical protein VMB78_04175 [Dissulfurispiraceae bacterium]|nr:hypothetical protein [Dissulfurispiraceae bacterium]
MITLLSDPWKTFEKYATEKGYTTKIIGSYELCNEQGRHIKLMTVREKEQKMAICEDDLKWYTIDLQ